MVQKTPVEMYVKENIKPEYLPITNRLDQIIRQLDVLNENFARFELKECMEALRESRKMLEATLKSIST